MTFADVVSRLTIGLSAELPGSVGQELMAPRPRRQWPKGFDAARIRSAAGLLVFFPVRDAAHLVLTVRANTVRHAGQVSLPGGVIEPGESTEDAALREAHEEIGLPPAGLTVRGALTPLDIPVSGFRLHPVVATLDHRPTLRAAHAEVERILEVPLADLMRPATVVETAREREGVPFVVPGFHVAGVEIWGATAMILSECLVLLGWTRN
jgi:8-oxo-dGTP pyrophosphatase MutT (NUDIX family)